MSEIELIDLIPTLAEPVDVAVDFDHLTVRDDGEFWFDAEPYLLLNFFTLDGNTARIEAAVDAASLEDDPPSFNVQLLPAANSSSIVALTTRGGHGNVGNVNIGPIELYNDGPKKVPITNGTGRFRATLKPIPIRLLVDGGDVLAGLDIVGVPGFIGVNAMLWEEDFTPNDAVQAANETVGEGIKSILEDFLSQVNLLDLSLDQSQFNERQQQIQDDAIDAAADEMNLFELIAGGVIDPDDLLILKLAVANVLQLDTKMDLQPPYEGPNGDWILVGEIRRE
jgi:hypothetical protein